MSEFDIHIKSRSTESFLLWKSSNLLALHVVTNDLGHYGVVVNQRTTVIDLICDDEQEFIELMKVLEIGGSVEISKFQMHKGDRAILKTPYKGASSPRLDS